jgi:hypothetical protein
MDMKVLPANKFQKIEFEKDIFDYPSEIKENCPDEFPRKEVKFFAIGLPRICSDFTVDSGGFLYGNTIESGELRKMDKFTGSSIIGWLFRNKDKDGDSYQITYAISFVDGKVHNVEQNKLIPIPSEEIRDTEKELNTAVKKMEAREKSVLFKTIYLPYRFVVRCFLFLALYSIDIVRRLTIKVGKMLIPW